MHVLISRNAELFSDCLGLCEIDISDRIQAGTINLAIAQKLGVPLCNPPATNKAKSQITIFGFRCIFSHLSVLID